MAKVDFEKKTVAVTFDPHKAAEAARLFWAASFERIDLAARPFTLLAGTSETITLDVNRLALKS